MSDRVFIPVLVAWVVAVLALSVPFPAILRSLVSWLRSARDTRASTLEIRLQVRAAEETAAKGSLPTQG